MFSSFFPNPRLFFPATVLWTAVSMALWYGFARDLGPRLSLGGLVGFPYPPVNADGAAIAVETALRRDAHAEILPDALERRAQIALGQPIVDLALGIDPAMKNGSMRRIDFTFQRLQPVAFLHPH